MTSPSKQTGGFLSSFTVLRGAMRELWIVFAAKMLGILAYAVMNSTLVLWLSSDLGYGDKSAGYLIAWWSTVMTLCTVLVGSLVDAIGLRKAFLLGFCVCILSRGVMTFATGKWLALGLGLLPLAVGEALMTPVMVAAVRRFSTTTQRSIAFSIFYAMMNGGFFIANWIFDWVRQGMGEHGHLEIPLLGLNLSTYRTLFLVSFLLTVPNLILMYFFLRPGVEATDEGVKFTPETPKYTGVATFKALRLMVSDTLRETCRIFVGLWQQPAFFKFLLFLSLVVAVRLIFYHMHYTYPKFGIRELGAEATIFSAGEMRNLPSFLGKLRNRADAVSEHLVTRFTDAGRQTLTNFNAAASDVEALRPVLVQELNAILAAGSIYNESRFTNVTLRAQTAALLAGQPQGQQLIRLNRLLLEDAYPKNLGISAPIGRLWSLNSLLILIVVPFVGALTQKISAYRMVVVGSFISALSVFIMALPTVWFRPLAEGWMGDLIAHRWLGVQGNVHPYYVMIFLYVLLLSLGEALWSPRLYEYTAAIAPKGQEASYMALSYLPFFIAKFFVGMFSGHLLERYCPESGPRDSQMLWLIIALTTIITPLGLLIFRRYIRVQEAGREN